MKILQIDARHFIVALESGMQVIYDRRIALAYQKPASDWKINEDIFLSDSLELVLNYIGRESDQKYVTIPNDVLQFSVERI